MWMQIVPPSPWDPQLCCSAFPLELHSILLPHSCGVFVWHVCVHPPHAILVMHTPS